MPWKQVKPVVDSKVRELCTRRYPNHPRGCPNFDKKRGCPPSAPLIGRLLDLESPVYAVYNVFPLGQHVEKMRGRHPGWTERQLRNCLYWQGTARKSLKAEIEKFEVTRDHGGKLVVVMTPEACGVNVTETMKQVGIELEWPPVQYALQIALVGLSSRKVKDWRLGSVDRG